MDWLITAGLIVGGVINLLPFPGALSGAALARLYDLQTADPNLLIMLRHRSAVFAILGVLLLAASGPSCRRQRFVRASPARRRSTSSPGRSAAIHMPFVAYSSPTSLRPSHLAWPASPTSYADG
jgi:hypothetical protein